MSLHLTGATDLDGRPVHVVVDGARVVSLDGAGPRPEEVVHVPDGTVVSGLRDSHLHLFALAAAQRSVDVSSAPDLDRLTLILAEARRRQPSGWLRAVGWHAGRGGELDRSVLDRVDSQPLRVQDHSGARWYLNSAALAETATGPLPPAVEVDGGGRPTGRVIRGDDWLARRLPPPDVDLADAAWGLTARGVTGVTDATPTTTGAELHAFARLPIQVTAMTGDPSSPPAAGVRLGQVKILLDDECLPNLDDLVEHVRAAHDAGRGVAVHCVTRVQLLLALAAMESAGVRPDDRIEHGSVIPAESVVELRRLGVGVATNPGFLRARGDVYLDDVEPSERRSLYRVRSLLAAGVAVVGATDAPFGPADPWAAVAAAIERRAPSGRSVAPEEAVDARTALGLFGARPVVVGAPADVCVLADPPAAVLVHPAAVTVAATVAGGSLVHRA